ncbi:HGL094Cp [Eremothecium sinecaudum]|uniref:HGL094Cp n=1 Tax=Eremothecium sinecaudum TaxID=45286 RepID=A0A109UY41_9SACH|nr:HGL094Cp [Eremothecium sinecaudum]AMD22246.1 HGL094Cp [Eremothecium sinecaudum]
MSFFAKISQLKKARSTNNTIKASTTQNVPDISKDPLDYEATSLLPKNYIRAEDPSIKILKEKRRQERLKNSSNSNSKKRISGATSKKSSKTDDQPNFSTKWKLPKPSSSANHVSKPKITGKRLTFEELKKQAEERAGSRVVEAESPTSSIGSITSTLSKPNFKPKMSRKSSSPNKVIKKRSSSNEGSVKAKVLDKEAQARPKVPPSIGIAKPNENLRKILEKRKNFSNSKRHDEDWSDLDDFIDDDEEAGSEDYNRDEIWSIFSKGRKRRYVDDYDDDKGIDDMEANEMEVLEEEDYSARVARKEDKMEEAWLRKHENEKKNRKKKKN